MRYISGIYALNHEANCGKADWHMHSRDWSKATFKETSDSILNSKGVLNFKGEYVANVARAFADLLEEHKFRWLKGFRTEFLLDDETKQELFSYARKLNDIEVDLFMGSEYGTEYFTEVSKPFTEYFESKGLRYVG